MLRVAITLAVAGTSVIVNASPARQSRVETHPGIFHEVWRDGAIPADMHVVRIDLTSSEITMLATPESAKGHRTTFFAAQGEPSVIAINGGAFNAGTYAPVGFAIGDGAAWSQTADDTTRAVLHFRREGEHTVATIDPPETTTSTQTVPPGTAGAVSGGPMLVRANNVQTFDCNDQISIPCTRAPRTAVGITADGFTLIAVVVDGWKAASHGMKADELAAFIRARGAADAIMLDSGSSSTLVVDGDYVNVPSDGAERIVSNHLGWRYGALPGGELTGAICRDMLSNCTNPNDTSMRITGATVTLDDTRTDVSTTAGCPDNASCATYDFGGVTPRYACVTVKKTGFHTAHKCAQVTADGQPTYNSVVLIPGDDPIDAGVPDDASEVPVDGDPGEVTDGGPGLQPPGPGGCCDAGGDPVGGMLLMALSGFQLRRRRGKTKAA